MSPRTGRPPKGDQSRNINLNIRVTPEEAHMIQHCAEKLAISRTDVIMRGVKMVQAGLNKK